MSGAGAAIMGGSNFQGFNYSGLGGSEQKISMNLEDVILHEQKLNNILEVSMMIYLLTLSTESEKR